MFLGSRKKAKLEEARKKEQQFIREEAELKRQEFEQDFVYNKVIFNNICNMVRSLPKERHIVVVQRKNIFKSGHFKNWAYIQLAREMKRQHNRTGIKWMSAYDKNNDSLYAFYAPTKLTDEFEQALKNFSKDGYRIQRIRYYSRNL